MSAVRSHLRRSLQAGNTLAAAARSYATALRLYVDTQKETDKTAAADARCALENAAVVYAASLERGKAATCWLCGEEWSAHSCPDPVTP